MAKSARRRAMPRTPQDRPAMPSPAREPVAQASTEHRPSPRPTPTEKPHVLAGTGCTAGHVRGQELDAGRLGTLPSQKRARIGFGLVLWCVGGIGVLAATGITSWTWAEALAQVAVLWLAFAALVVRRAGHRRRCWRTRSWRHAWGGLAPGS